MRKISLLIFITYAFSQIAFSQATFKQTDILKSYKEAEELVNLGKFAVAQPILQDFLQQYEQKTLDKSNMIYADAIFLKALCEKETASPEAEKDLQYFADNFKGHPKTNSAYFHLGDIAFGKANYNDALAFFEKVDEKSLTGKDVTEFEYKRAFAHFALKKFSQARMYFNLITLNKKHPYHEDAYYYSGLSSYYLKDYNAAYKSFQPLEVSKKYAKIVPYYITSIKFINKDYKGVVEYAEPKLKEKVSYQNEMMHLLGNAYYELKNYDKALFYLEQYTQKSAKVTPEDYYILGYVQAQNGKCDKAIDNLKELSPLQTALSQNAMYLLGQCYEKSGNKSEARTAFLQAARMSFDKVIQEEAWFSYAKLSYELGFTNDALVALKNFIQAYPKSTHTLEANELLADLFLMTRNYEEAMSIIDNLPIKSDKLKEAYQKMAYFRAVENYNDYKYDAAESFFDKSLKYPISKSLEALCYYWKADIAHQKSAYDKSISGISKFLPMAYAVNTIDSDKVNAGTANYLQGYNFYKKKDYANSVSYFSKAVSSLRTDANITNKNNILPDALIRLADGYFMQKQYKQSAQYYEEVIKSNALGADYALYQKSIIDGLGGNYNDKIAGMKALVARFPNSAFADDAIMQTGNTYMAQEKDDLAIETYKSLITKNPKSDQIPEAYLKLGLIYFNKDSYDESLTWYQKVVHSYPNTPTSNEAMLAIKEIYIAKGDPNGYIAFANKYPGSKVTVSEQDSIIYLAAEKQFFNGNMESALQGFSNYLSQFPNGYFALQANFYKSECLFTKQDFSNALKGYEYVISQAQNRFSERSTARAANINYYDLRNYVRSYELYTKLQTIASLDENKREAVIGLMRTSFYLKKYQECIDYASKVAVLPALPEFYKAEIAYYKGMCLFQQKDYDKSIKELEYVVKNANNEQAAESKYTVSKMYYLKGNKKQAEKECNDYLDKFPSYEYYLGKTFILLSDIYKDDKKLLQAKATLQSLLDNYSQDDDVKAEAQQKLDVILASEMEGSKLKLPDNSTQMQFDSGK
ncbi:MAG TPA: tetratricopeptide repeat protein [Chitinophagales bacterium]|nr:tetratricopeptide repeat protein [Chitinophagales bacterium]